MVARRRRTAAQQPAKRGTSNTPPAPHSHLYGFVALLLGTAATVCLLAAWSYVPPHTSRDPSRATLANPDSSKDYTVLERRRSTLDSAPLGVVDYGEARYMLRKGVLLGAVYTPVELRSQAAMTCFAVMQSACWVTAVTAKNDCQTASGATDQSFLQLGLGVGAVPLFMHRHCSRFSAVHAVELDPDVAELARRHFYYSGPSAPIIQDARAHLFSEPPRPQSYSVVVHDLFSGSNGAMQLLSRTLLQRIKDAWLRPCGGVFVLNIVAYHHGEHAAFAEAVVRTLRAVWRRVRCFRDVPPGVNDEEPSNLSCFAAETALKFELPRELRDRPDDGSLSAYDVMRHFQEWEVMRESHVATEGPLIEDDTDATSLFPGTFAAIERRIRGMVRPMLPEGAWDDEGVVEEEELSPPPVSPTPPLGASALCRRSLLNCRDVGRVSWMKDKPFASWAATHALPVVLTGTRLQSWRLLDAFNQDDSGQRLAELATARRLRNVYVRRGTTHRGVFSYWHGRKPLCELSELGPEAQRRLAIDVVPEMNSDAFFDRVWGRGGRRDSDKCYYSNPIEKDFEALLPLLGETGLEWMSPRNNSSSSLSRQIMLWMGGGGVTTPTHNDAFHNVYVQLKGEKQFILFPPSLHAQLHVFPALHPQHQQSQVLLYNGSAKLSDATAWSSFIPGHFPNFLKWATSLSESTEAGRPLLVTLAPGEVLYIPPLWYHYTTSLTPSASLNVWTTSDEAIAFQEAFGRRDAIEDGCLFGEGERDRAASGRSYLTLLIKAVLAGGAAASDGRGQETAEDFVRDVVLIPRYFPLLETAAMPSFADPTQYLFCASESDGLLQPSGSCAEAIRAQSDALVAIGDRSKQELRLADVVEFTALWAVGAHNVSAFLLDFARC